MAWKGISHKQVGLECSQDEYEHENAHELQQGAELPPSDNHDGDLFFKTDTKRLYIWIE